LTIKVLCGILTLLLRKLPLKDIALFEPKDNPDYKIYHFFAKDTEGRSIDFQYFWDK